MSGPQLSKDYPEWPSRSLANFIRAQYVVTFLLCNQRFAPNLPELETHLYTSDLRQNDTNSKLARAEAQDFHHCIMDRDPERISRSRSPRRDRPHYHKDGSRRDRHSPEHRSSRRSHPDRRSRSPEARSYHASRRKYGHSSGAHNDGHREKREPVSLPFAARPLSKHDLTVFRQLFGYFLSVQKQIELEDIDEREVKGRWKSFIGKWNRGELAEGWYDPEMFARVTSREPQQQQRREERESEQRKVSAVSPESKDERVGDSDDDYGPALPSSARAGRRPGPGVPSLDDLTHRNELLASDADSALEAHRLARKAERNLQKERLEELVPRADAGTRERKLEKRQAVNDKMREFREKSPGGEVGDSQLMGGEEDSLQELRKAREREQRKKSEREIKREEIERARREEREERRRAYEQKEEERMKGFKELARQRFG